MYIVLNMLLDKFLKHASYRAPKPVVSSSSKPATGQRKLNNDDIVFEDFARMRLQGTFCSLRNIFQVSKFF